MTHKMARIMILSLAAVLMVAAVAGCGLLGGDEEEVVEEPTPDVAAAIQTAVAASIPTETPTPPPTDTPTPDIQATIDAALTATQIAMAPTPAPTDVPPTEVPVVAATNTPVPTDTPQPTPTRQASNPVSGPPAVIVGSVTINNQKVGAGTTVIGKPQDGGAPVTADTDANGNYRLEISNLGAIYDLYVGATDSTVDTDATVKGQPQVKHLSITR